MRKLTDAEHQTMVQKWVAAIVVVCILMCVFPPVGLLLGFVLGWQAVRRISKRQAEARRQREFQRLAIWRGDPQNEMFIQGNAADGGLSIEERNAYRRQANKYRR